MINPIHPATIARLRELIERHRTAAAYWFDTGCTDEERPHLRRVRSELSEHAINALPSLLDQLAAQAAEIERLNKGFHESCIAREEAANARAKKAEARVAELEDALGDALPFLRSEAALWMDGRWESARDMANRIDATLAKREGGR